MRKLIFVFITLALAACSLGSQTEIERNKEKWQAASISHYRFNLFVGCFCVFSQDMPLVIEVRNGEVVSMEYQSGNEIDASSRELFEQYATIDHIFAELEKDINGEADEVVVKYDPMYGFPTEANIDVIKDAIDDELALTVSNFEKLP
ncbi:MAG TPA: DUF6174 domain-containing protein [Anaerolineales bacterium]|nr:DUF6174 domain-containing protein [Anaerolineales bacterium]